jgi:hypothetical protein
MKETKVTLKIKEHTEEFGFDHAERLLRLNNNGGWELPQDSEFEFINNGLEFRGHKKSDSGKKEQGNNQQGNKPSEQN